jgi:DNA-binding GntR family transcriptional regulator
MFVANASGAQIAALKDALDKTVAAYEANVPEDILAVKNEFYRILFVGAGSEILSSMIASLHARIWRWRALGLGHPKRSLDRSQESIAGLRALHTALRERDATRAEAIARQEVTNAGAEIMRIFGVSETHSFD